LKRLAGLRFSLTAQIGERYWILAQRMQPRSQCSICSTNNCLGEFSIDDARSALLYHQALRNRTEQDFRDSAVLIIRDNRDVTFRATY